MNWDDIPDADDKSLYKEGLDSFLKGDKEGALSSWKSAVKLNPKNIEARRGVERLELKKLNVPESSDTSKERYKSGLEAYLGGDIEKAKIAWAEAVEDDPLNIEARRGLERLFQKEGKTTFGDVLSETLIKAGATEARAATKDPWDQFPDEKPKAMTWDDIPDEKPKAVTWDDIPDVKTGPKTLAGKAVQTVKDMTLTAGGLIPRGMGDVKKILSPMPGQAGFSGVLQEAGEKVGEAARPSVEEGIDTIMGTKMAQRFPKTTAAAMLPGALFLEMNLTPSDFAMALPLAMGGAMIGGASAGRIGKGGGGPSVPPVEKTVSIVPGKAANFMRAMYDRFSPIKYLEGKKIANEFENAGGKYTQAYVDARLMAGRTRGIGSQILSEIDDIVGPLKDYGDRQLLNKVYSLRNFIDLDTAGKRTSGVTADMARAELEAMKKSIGEKKYNTINDVADQLADIQNNKGLDILVESKVISKESAARLKEKYPNYLRSEILDEELGVDHPSFLRKTGEPIGRVNTDFLKTKKGTDLAINTDVLDVIRRSILSKVAAAEKQKVVDSIAKDFGVDVGRSLFKEGKLITEVDPAKIPKGYVKSNVKASGGRIFAVSEEVNNLLQGLNRTEADMITKAVGKVNALFRVSATTYRLPFIITNLARDIQTAVFNKRFVPKQTSQIGAYAKGFVSAVKNTFGISDATFAEWQSKGGGYGGLVTSLAKESKLPFRLRTTGEKAATLAKQPFTLPFELVAKLAEVSENTSRLAEFIRLKGTGLPEKLRVLQARDITVDFEKFGDSMRLANMWIPFLNANIQGTINTARAFKDQPAKSVMRAGKYVVAPAVALYAWNRQFENDKYVDPYVKENYWYLNTGVSIERNGRNVPVLGLVRKGEFAKQLSGVIELLLGFSAKDPGVKDRLRDYTAENIGMSFLANFTPPPLRVVGEQVANIDLFRKRKVVPEMLKDVSSGSQFMSGTRDISRRLGELTGISPVRFEHALQGALPASGQVLDAADVILRPKPKVPREKREGLMSSSLQPMVRPASGYYSPEEEEAKRFLSSARRERRTPKFVFQQAYRMYLKNRTEENLDRVKRLAPDVLPRDRVEAMKQENKNFRETFRPDLQRAARRVLPKNLRRDFMRTQ